MMTEEYKEIRLFLASHQAHKTFMSSYLTKLPSVIDLDCGGKIQLCKRSCVSFEKLKELGEEKVNQAQVSRTEFWLPIDIVKSLDLETSNNNTSGDIIKEIASWLQIAREEKKLYVEECKLPISFPSLMEGGFSVDALARLHIVADTNIFLSDFSLLERFKSDLAHISKEDENSRSVEACICLPQIVTKELDVLHSSDIAECCNGIFIAFSILTRTVLKRLTKLVESGNKFFKAENKVEREKAEVLYQRSGLRQPISEVLQTCLYLGKELLRRSQPESPGFVMLLSNNKQMIATANSLGIVAFDTLSFPEDLWSLRLAIKRSYEMLYRLKDVVGCNDVDTDFWQLPSSIPDDNFEKELSRMTDRIPNALSLNGSVKIKQRRDESEYEQSVDVLKAFPGRQKQSRFFPHITNLDAEEAVKSPKYEKSNAEEPNEKVNPWTAKKIILKTNPITKSQQSSESLSRKSDTNLRKLQIRKERHSRKPSSIEDFPPFPPPPPDMLHMTSRGVMPHSGRYLMPGTPNPIPSPHNMVIGPPPQPIPMGSHIISQPPPPLSHHFHQQQGYYPPQHHHMMSTQQMHMVSPPPPKPAVPRYMSMDLMSGVSNGSDVLSAQILSQLYGFGGNVGDRGLWQTLAKEAVTVLERYLSPVIQYVLQIKFLDQWADHIPTCPPWTYQMLFQMIDNLWSIFSEVFPVVIRTLKDEIERLLRRAEKEEVSAEMLVRLMASIRDMFNAIPEPNIPCREEELKHCRIQSISPGETVQFLNAGRDEISGLYNSAIRNIQACITEASSKGMLHKNYLSPVPPPSSPYPYEPVMQPPPGSPHPSSMPQQISYPPPSGHPAYVTYEENTISHPSHHHGYVLVQPPSPDVQYSGGGWYGPSLLPPPPPQLVQELYSPPPPGSHYAIYHHVHGAMQPVGLDPSYTKWDNKVPRSYIPY